MGMKNNLVVNVKKDELLEENNLQNASALLALLHGKSDSICRIFNKEIMVGKSDLKTLNDMMIEKLSLNNVLTITTSIDISFNNKKTISFKSWDEFEFYDFDKINSPTKTIFLQWDFFVKLANYEIPQRHTVGIRIASTPNPSDVFKAFLSGGFDESDSFEVQGSTMICKVDFINNTLAEELIHVAEGWNDLCESAYSEKGVIRPLLQKNRSFLAHSFEVCLSMWIVISIAIVFKLLLERNLFVVTVEILLYLLIFSFPVTILIRKISGFCGKTIFENLGDLMSTHIFTISKGDEKERERIKQKSGFGKELFAYVINTIITIVTSAVFLFLD